MSNKMERFTNRARRVIVLSQEEAVRQQKVWITPVHLLIALALEEGSIARAALNELGADAEQLRKAQPEAESAKTLDYLSPSLDEQYKKSLEYAVDEAVRTGDSFIGTEHLLLGLLRLDDADLKTTLDTCALDKQRIRQMVCTILETHTAKAKPKRKPKINASDEPIDILEPLERKIIALSQTIAETVQSLFSGKRKR